MLIVTIRAIILYTVLLISMRVMGKGDLGDLQPFDLVVSLILAELAAMPMADLNSPLSHGFMAIATIMFLQIFISFVNLKSAAVRKIICGVPTVLLDHGKFNIKDMNRLRVNINDILGQMRNKGYYNIQDIDYVIMETNGDMSIIAKAETPGERCKRIPYAIILDGKIMNDNLISLNISKEKIEKELQKQKLPLKNIIYGFVDEDDKYFFYERELWEHSFYL